MYINYKKTEPIAIAYAPTLGEVLEEAALEVKHYIKKKVESLETTLVEAYKEGVDKVEQLYNNFRTLDLQDYFLPWYLGHGSKLGKRHKARTKSNWKDRGDKRKNKTNHKSTKKHIRGKQKALRKH